MLGEEYDWWAKEVEMDLGILRQHFVGLQFSNQASARY